MSVPVSGDALYEADESFSVALSTPPAARPSPTPAALGTIANDDAAPALSINDVSRDRGQQRHHERRLHGEPLGRQRPAGDGRLGDRRRHRRRPRRLRGRLRQPRPSPPARPRGRSPWPSPATPSPSPTRASLVNLSGAGGASLADASGAGTIRNDDAAPRPRDQRRHRHRGQQRHAERRLHGEPLGRLPAGRHASTTRPPTAPPTAGSDYTAASGTLTFAAGVTSQTRERARLRRRPLRGRRELQRRPLRRQRRDHRRRQRRRHHRQRRRRRPPSRSTTSPSPRATAAPRAPSSR